MMVAASRVLLVSESRITRRVVEMTFADQPIDLVTAVTGPAGLAAWEERAAAVVLADVAMDCAPAGLALARHLRGLTAERPVPVLLLAGQHEVLDEAEIAAAGLHGVLRKPLDSLELIEAVRGALRATSAPPASAVAGRLATPPWAPVVETAGGAELVPPATQAGDAAGLLSAGEAAPCPPAPPAAEDAVPTLGLAVAADAAPREERLERVADAALRDEDLERLAVRVAALLTAGVDGEGGVAALVAERARQAAAASAAATAERVAPDVTLEVAERLVRELAPALVSDVARAVVAGISERLVREEIARMRSTRAA